MTTGEAQSSSIYDFQKRWLIDRSLISPELLRVLPQSDDMALAKILMANHLLTSEQATELEQATLTAFQDDDTSSFKDDSEEGTVVFSDESREDTVAFTAEDMEAEEHEDDHAADAYKTAVLKVNPLDVPAKLNIHNIKDLFYSCKTR